MPESTVAAALAAEEAGFDDVWITEHHFMAYGICLQRSLWRGTCSARPAGSRSVPR